jgi:hypothetical protein
MSPPSGSNKTQPIIIPTQKTESPKKTIEKTVYINPLPN